MTATNGERLYLFDTTLRCPFARRSEALEHEQYKKCRPGAAGGGL